MHALIWLSPDPLCEWCALTEHVATKAPDTKHTTTCPHPCRSCGTRGVPENLSSSRSSAFLSSCKRTVHFQPLQLERTLANSDCAVVQKQDGCWWFGQPGRCGSWNILIATFIVAAGTDFVLVAFKVFLGNENSGKSAREQRYCSHTNRLQTFEPAQVCRCLQACSCMQARIWRGHAVHCV